MTAFTDPEGINKDLNDYTPQKKLKPVQNNPENQILSDQISNKNFIEESFQIKYKARKLQRAMKMDSMPKQNRRDHLANERTFLAWIRTSLGVMAFGFVVEKFTLFMKQISYFLGKQEAIHIPTYESSYSSILGILLVIIGILIGLFAYFKYRITGKQIDQDIYQPSLILPIVLTLTVVILGGFLVIYLIV